MQYCIANNEVQNETIHAMSHNLYHPLNLHTARSQFFIFVMQRSWFSSFGVKMRSTLRSRINSSRDFQMPVFSPAKNPAPNELNSESKARSTFRFVRSESN